MDRASRAVGAIVGLAVGDALGAPFEFRRARDVPTPLPAFELPWMDQPPGTWTDDTALARNLWTSLLAHEGELVPDDVLARHQAWLDTRPPDVGNQTRAALLEAREGTPEPARAVFERRGPEVSAGNGSVMACAPLGVVRADDPERLRLEAPAFSRITHWDGRCATACLAVTWAIAALVRGDGAEDAVRAALGATQGNEGDEELEHLVAEAGRARPLDGPDMGFTFFCAGIALQVAGEGRGFEDGLRHVVALGGDTDTNAAVAGALLGAAHGEAAIPPAWLDRLAQREAIVTEARELAVLAG